MDIHEIAKWLSEIECWDHKYKVAYMNQGERLSANPESKIMYIQVVTRRPCSVSKHQFKRQKGRKWFISQHATISEVIQTAFLASKQYEEHELRENFAFQGEPVFRPHFDVFELWDLSNNDKIDARKEKDEPKDILRAASGSPRIGGDSFGL